MKQFEAELTTSLSKTGADLLQKGLIDEIRLPEGAVSRLAGYLQLLIDWTDRIDLVSPGSPETLIDRHIRDAYASWLLLQARGFFSQQALLDVGSGAGLPGLIYAALSPEHSVVLCEPRQKRAIFLQEVKRRLGLPCVSVANKRLGEIRREELPEIGLATFRALRPEGELLEEAEKLLEARASIAFLTGAGEDLSVTVSWESERLNYSLSGDNRGRSIILLKKSTG